MKKGGCIAETIQQLLAVFKQKDLVIVLVFYTR